MADEEQIVQPQPQPEGKSKTAIGFVCAFFLGLFGLFFLLCWPAGSYERKTFLRGWMWTFFTLLIVEIVFIILYVTVLAGVFGSLFMF